ncbi:Uncharacterized membrane protein [Lachnospiraceae bacterium]|nr:Uncharacterized membrane protein [Lachnospiraceae bacterium]
MNKITFMSELSRRLRRLPKEDYDDAMKYYAEYFLDAGIDDNQDVTPLVGTVDEVASRIIDEASEKQIVKAETEGGAKNSSRAIWYIILGIFAAPIALPIAIAIVSVIFAVFVAVIAVVFSMLAAGAAVTLSGIGVICAAFWAESMAQVMLIVGAGLICFSVGIVLCIGFYKLGEVIIRGLIKLLRNIGKKKKDEVKAGGAN